MSGNERKEQIQDPRIRANWEVTYHELRGYDSPSKWHEVRYKGELVTEFGRGPEERERAIQLAMGPPPRTRHQRIRDTGPEKEFQVVVASDDLISYAWDGTTEEVGSPEMDFEIEFPGGPALKLKVDYGSWGWQFTTKMPPGTQIKPIPPSNEEDDDP